MGFFTPWRKTKRQGPRSVFHTLARQTINSPPVVAASLPPRGPGHNPAGGFANNPAGGSGNNPPSGSESNLGGGSANNPAGGSSNSPPSDSGNNPRDTSGNNSASDSTSNPSGDSAKTPPGDSADNPLFVSGSHPPSDSANNPTDSSARRAPRVIHGDPLDLFDHGSHDKSNPGIRSVLEHGFPERELKGPEAGNAQYDAAEKKRLTKMASNDEEDSMVHSDEEEDPLPYPVTSQGDSHPPNTENGRKKRGQGVFANRNLQKGWRIIEENPAISCVHHKGKKEIYDLWYGEMTEEQRQPLRETFRKLKRVDVLPGLRRWRLEKFVGEYAFWDPRRDKAHIYALASQINHACKSCANAFPIIDSAEPNKITVRLVRALETNEEVFIHYHKKVSFGCAVCGRRKPRKDHPGPADSAIDLSANMDGGIFGKLRKASSKLASRLKASVTGKKYQPIPQRSAPDEVNEPKQELDKSETAKPQADKPKTNKPPQPDKPRIRWNPLPFSTSTGVYGSMSFM
ncbi:hypothetical protein G7046_g5276 [Stylonectria norvegica]|nr:hypothetical protein G7046_g5276 [Stylonectria norvegica]